jgi:predicted CXXCH cytochrome family protein
VHFLIRKQTGRGDREALETEYQGDALTLGAASDAMVPLAGVQGQLRVESSGANKWRVVAKKSSFELNGESVSRAELKVGDVLLWAGHTLTVIAAPAGFDFAMELVVSADARGMQPAAMTLAQTAWSNRRVGWALAVVILAAFLVLPLAGVFQADLAALTRQTALPDDGLWSSGPLAAAHQTSGIAADCQACHQEPFAMVKDTACLDCHRETHEHVDVSLFEAHAFTGERCASCHREHNEPAQLVRRDNALCSDCHVDPDAWQRDGRAPMQSVSAFTEQAHPTFRLALLMPQGPGAAHGWQVDRVRAADGEVLQEQSNLKFTHAVHLDPDKVQSESSGSALQCDSCHTAKDDGEHFEPVTMDNHCRSCHTLNFDVFEPDLELPHGDQRAAVVAMEAHFIREFTDPDLRRERAASKPRRVPGKRESAASCTGSGLDCGRAEALKEAEYQFAETGCVTCHVVEDTGLSDINDRWFVQPVRVTDDWYPFSRFDHASHRSLAVEGSGEVCESCHQASLSEQSSDVLIPGQDNCLSCHSQDKGFSQVDCVSCHVFHHDGGTRSVLAREKVPGHAATSTIGGGGE